MTKKVILIVDDDPHICSLIRETLRGYQVHEAHDGEDALRVLKRVTPDLIILDVMMPRINGRDLCRALKLDDARKDIPILMLSGLQRMGQVEEAFVSGAEDYLPKPFSPKVLVGRVRQLLGEGGPAVQASGPGSAAA